MNYWEIWIILCFVTVVQGELYVNITSSEKLTTDMSGGKGSGIMDNNYLSNIRNEDVIQNALNIPAACECGENAECHLNDQSTQISSCNPGYAMWNGTCKPCNCEPGYNCTFGDGSGYGKVCFCPNGYADYRGTCSVCNCGLEDSNCSLSYGGSMMSCGCPKGYEELRDRSMPYKSSCKDIDECVREQKPCNDPHAKCTNIPGSYRCDCLRGFLLLKLDVEKRNTCLEDLSSWRTAAIVIGCTFGLILIGVSIAIYLHCRKGRRSCQCYPLTGIVSDGTLLCQPCI